jgi:hypothetical protein
MDIADVKASQVDEDVMRSFDQVPINGFWGGGRRTLTRRQVNLCWTTYCDHFGTFALRIISARTAVIVA